MPRKGERLMQNNETSSPEVSSFVGRFRGDYLYS